MNKINIEQDKIFLDNGIYFLEVSDDIELDIEIKENAKSKLIIVGNSSYKINYLLKNNSELIVHSLNKDNSVNVSITLLEKSKLTYHHSVINNLVSDNIFKIIHQENESISNIYNNGINQSKDKLFFQIDGIIPKGLTNIICSQSSKIINFNNGNSKIIPNLIIDSNDIVASHAAYIGNIDNDTKFYLESRGIKEENIKKLIYQSIMLGKMELMEEKDLFDKLINEWW